MSFSINKSMLTESANPIAYRVPRGIIPTDRYFNIALGKAESVHEDYSSARFDLYSGMLLEGATEEFKKLFSDAYERSYPAKQDQDINAVKESCSSTDEFVAYFGNAVKVLNTAAGNMVCTCDKACNQAKILVKKSVTESVGDADTCPVCGTNPCTCGDGEECKNHEHIYDFKNDEEIPTLGQMKINPASEINVVVSGSEINEDIQKKYNELVGILNDFYDRFRAMLCHNESYVTKKQYGKMLYEATRTPVTCAVNKKYLKYCSETVANYQNAVNSVRENAVRIAGGYIKAAEAIKNASMITETRRFVAEDGSYSDMPEQTAETIDLYCKAEVDKLVNMCTSHMLAIGAKLDSLRDELDQCSAVLSKYTANGPALGLLPTPADAEPETDPTAEPDVNPDPEVQPDASVVQEHPSTEPSVEYEAFLIDLMHNEMAVSELLANQQSLSEGTIEYLNEGVLNAAKSIWDKIMDTIKNIIEKASVTIDNQKDIAFLTNKNNQDIIRNKPIKPAKEPTTGWHDYNVDLFKKTFDPNVKDLVMDPSGVITNLTDDERNMAESIDNCVQKLFPDVTRINAETLSDKFKTYFMGEAKSINMATITPDKLVGMMEFCIGFKNNTYAFIKGDQAMFNKVYKSSTNALNKIKTVSGPATGSDNNQNSNNQNNNGQAKTEAFTFGKMMDTYFTEADQKESNANNANANNGGSLKIGAADDSQQNGGNNNSTGNNNNDQNGDNIRKKPTTDGDKKLLQNYYTNILKLSQTYFAAKLTAALKCRKDYMDVLKWHVSQYGGNTSDNADNNGQNSNKGNANNNGQQEQPADNSDHSLK